jgi:hypothetical protein
MMLIKDKFHKDEKSLLLVLCPLDLSNQKFFDQVKNARIFDEVMTAKDFGPSKDPEADYEKQIVEFFDDWQVEYGYDFRAFSNIYCGFDTVNWLGAYLDIRGIEHCVIIASGKNIIYDIEHIYAGKPQRLTDFSRKHCSLLGEGKYTLKRFADKRVEIEKPLEKDVILDVQDLWLNISNELKRKISSILPQEELKKLSDEESYLVLPNSTGYMRPKTGLPNDRRCYVYQLTLDFYCNAGKNARIYYKEHPQVNLSDGDKYFKNCTVLNPIVPVEFYTSIDGFSVNNLIAVTSTAGKWLTPFVKNFYNPAEIYFYTFREIYRHFAAFAIDELVSDEKTNYHICGINKPFIEDFTTNVLHRKIEYKGLNQTILKGNIFTLLDDVNVKSLIYGLTDASNDAKCVIYYTDMFYLPKYIPLRQYVVPIQIKKCVTDENCIADIDDEYIYFFCKDATVRDKVKKLNKIKVLLHTQIALNIKVVSDTFWQRYA